MIPFLVAQAFVCIAVGAIAVVSNRQWLEWQPWEYGTKPALLIAVLPVLGAWLACEMIRLVRPVRLLDARIKGFAGRFSAGLAAGLQGFLLTLLVVEFVHGVWAEGALTTGAGFVSAAAVSLCSSRVRPGRCVQCQYDLATITTASHGRCPECGNALCGA